MKPTRQSKCKICGEPCSRKYCSIARCQRLGRVLYNRKYRLANLEHMKTYQKAYREKNIKKINNMQGSGK